MTRVLFDCCTADIKIKCFFLSNSLKERTKRVENISDAEHHIGRPRMNLKALL